MAIALTDRRKVGATSFEVQPLGFGGSALGELMTLVDEPTSQATLNTAWDSGIRYYDTAAWYGRGLSEHRIGGFLRTKPRDQFSISTKVGRTLHRPADPRSFDTAPWRGGFKFEVRFDYSRHGILHSYGQALQRLGLDTVDALLIHDLDADYHGAAQAGHERDLLESGFKALEELKASGDIKAVGMGINSLDALEQIATRIDADFFIVASPYTLLDQSALHTGMARCVERGIGVVIGAPFASGILAVGSGKGASYRYAKAPPEIEAQVRRIEAVCAAHNVELAAAALQFPLAHPAVVSIIPGVLSPQQIQQNIVFATTPIPQAFWSDLKSEGLIDKEAPTP